MSLVMEFEGIKVNDVIHNVNGEDYTVVAINAKRDRTLLVKHGTTYPNYVGVYALQKAVNRNGWYWGQGHYFLDDLTAAVEYVTGATTDV